LRLWTPTIYIFFSAHFKIQLLAHPDFIIKASYLGISLDGTKSLAFGGIYDDLLLDWKMECGGDILASRRLSVQYYASHELYLTKDTMDNSLRLTEIKSEATLWKYRGQTLLTDDDEALTMEGSTPTFGERNSNVEQQGVRLDSRKFEVTFGGLDSLVAWNPASEAQPLISTDTTVPTSHHRSSDLWQWDCNYIRSAKFPDMYLGIRSSLLNWFNVSSQSSPPLSIFTIKEGHLAVDGLTEETTLELRLFTDMTYEITEANSPQTSSVLLSDPAVVVYEPYHIYFPHVKKYLAEHGNNLQMVIMSHEVEPWHLKPSHKSGLDGYLVCNHADDKCLSNMDFNLGEQYNLNKKSHQNVAIFDSCEDGALLLPQGLVDMTTNIDGLSLTVVENEDVEIGQGPATKASNTISYRGHINTVLINADGQDNDCGDYSRLCWCLVPLGKLDFLFPALLWPSFAISYPHMHGYPSFMPRCTRSHGKLRIYSVPQRQYKHHF
jgi:hypothetical protein